MKVLVTGSTGLVGTALVNRLVSLNKDEITAFVHHKKPDEDNIDWYNGDLENYQDCLAATEGIDVVYHCAAQSFGAAQQGKDPASLVRPNVVMNANLIDAAYRKGVKKFIYLTSTTSYPRLDRDVKEEDLFVDNPPPMYFGIGWTKRFALKLCDFYSNYVPNPMVCIGLNPSNIFGISDKYDFDKCHVLPALIRRFAEKQNPLEVWGDPTKTTRDFLYVEDMVDAILAATNYNKFDTFNIAGGWQWSIQDCINCLSFITGHKPEIKQIEGKPSMIANRGVNIDKAKKLLGWYPATSFHDGLVATINGYKAKYGLS